MEMDFDDLIYAYLDGELDPAAAESLGAWIQADPANGEHYLRCVALHWDVYTQVYASQAIRTMQEAAMPDTAASLPTIVSDAATTASPRRKPLYAPVLNVLKVMAGQPAMLAVLVVSLVSGAVLVYQLSRQPLPIADTESGNVSPSESGLQSGLQPPGARTENAIDVKSRQVVARLTRTAGATWQQQFSPADGSALSVGQRLFLQQGLVEISFDTGTTVVLEGPAEFEVGSRKSEVGSEGSGERVENACALTLGKLVARVPKEAHGFTVLTPNMKIVDLGTEFGVQVKSEVGSRKSDGDSIISDLRSPTLTEVHVLRGEVAIRSASEGTNQTLAEKTSTILKAGEAVVSKPGEAAPRMLKAEPARFVRELPPAVVTPVIDPASPLKPGDILAVSRNTLKLVKIDPKTGEQKVLARGNRDLHGWEWMCVAVDAQGKILVGTDRGQGRGGQVLRIDARDGSIKVLASDRLLSAGRISGLAAAANGGIYAAQDGPEDKILGIDPQTGDVSTVVPFGNNIWGIASDVNGRDLLAISDGGDALAQIRGQTVSTWVRNPLFEGAPRGVCVRPDGRVFVTVTSHTHGRIVEVDRASHRLTEVVSVPRRDWSFGLPAIESDGNLIVGNDAPESIVYRINVDARTIVPISSTEHLERVLGVAVVPGRLASAQEGAR